MLKEDQPAPGAEGKGQTEREGNVEAEQVGKEELAGQPGTGTPAAAQSLQKSGVVFFEELDVVFTGELQHRWGLFSCRTIRFISDLRAVDKRNVRYAKCTIRGMFLKDNWYS